MTRAYFIDESFLKKMTSITKNVDIKELVPFFSVAQDTYIRSALGDAQYNRLQDAIINNDRTSDEIVLLNELATPLAYYIMYEAYPALSEKVRNIGIVSTTDINQTKVSEERFDKNRQENLSTAERYMTIIKRFLKNNKDLYPLVFVCNDEVNADLSSTFISPIYIDDCHLNKRFIKNYRHW